MSYYWFNRQKLLKKARSRYNKDGKEKATRYYRDNIKVLRQDARNKYRNLSEKEKEAKRKYGRNK